MLYDTKWGNPVITRTDLTEQEIKGLLRVRQALLDGTISAQQFAMDTTAKAVPECGTRGCIGGWIGIFAMQDADAKFNRKWGGSIPVKVWDKYFLHMGQIKFDPLFVPHGDFDWRYDEATPQDGVRAIDNFLRGEADPWKDWSPHTT